KTLGRAFRTARDKAMKQNVGGIEHVRTIQDRHGLRKLGVEDLRALAAAREVSGRGGMTKQQLIQSLTD
ncbi:MAG: Rho termination factor N-terminal domain-containing protein, partial [Actinomycetota bacterium]|nr:Rho termination factor N-terminal domain-containing protein [Actinomycetota bacterium]